MQVSVALNQASAKAPRLAVADRRSGRWRRTCESGGLGDDLRRMTHREALAIAERLAATDPDNAEHQRDLAVSHDRLGTSPPPSHEPRSPGV